MHDDGTRSFAARAWYECVRVGVFAGLTVGWSLRIRGQRHVPAEGPLLLLANHVSHIDPAVAGVACPRRLTYLARHDLFHIPLVGPFIRSVGAVPIIRTSAKDGIKTGRAVLGARRALLMFPEGTRSPDGTLQPFKDGFTMLCCVPGLRIVPVGIRGTDGFWPKGKWPRRLSPPWMPRGRASMAVSFGPPIDAASLPADRAGAARTVRDAVAAQIALADAFGG